MRPSEFQIERRYLLDLCNRVLELCNLIPTVQRRGRMTSMKFANEIVKKRRQKSTPVTRHDGLCGGFDFGKLTEILARSISIHFVAYLFQITHKLNAAGNAPYFFRSILRWAFLAIQIFFFQRKFDFLPNSIVFLSQIFDFLLDSRTDAGVQRRLSF